MLWGMDGRVGPPLSVRNDDTSSTEEEGNEREGEETGRESQKGLRKLKSLTAHPLAIVSLLSTCTLPELEHLHFISSFTSSSSSSSSSSPDFFSDQQESQEGRENVERVMMMHVDISFDSVNNNTIGKALGGLRGLEPWNALRVFEVEIQLQDEEVLCGFEYEVGIIFIYF